MSRKDQKLEHLSNVPMFSALTQTELRTLGRLTDEVTVKAGKVLCEEGTTGHEFYLVLDGEASVKRGKKTIATLRRGDYFGELSLLDGGERSATVAAATDLEVLVIGQKEFTTVLRELPNVARKFLAAMAKRLRDSDAKALANN
jgi:CRP-like cAMP-binding protein